MSHGGDTASGGQDDESPNQSDDENDANSDRDNDHRNRQDSASLQFLDPLDMVSSGGVVLGRTTTSLVPSHAGQSEQGSWGEHRCPGVRHTPTTSVETNSQGPIQETQPPGYDSLHHPPQDHQQNDDEGNNSVNASRRVPYDGEWHPFSHKQSKITLRPSQCGIYFILRETSNNEGLYLHKYNKDNFNDKNNLLNSKKISDDTVHSTICESNNRLYLYNRICIEAYDIHMQVVKSEKHAAESEDPLDMVINGFDVNIYVLLANLDIKQYEKSSLNLIRTLERGLITETPVLTARMTTNTDGHLIILSVHDVTQNDSDLSSNGRQRVEMLLTKIDPSTGEQRGQDIVLNLETEPTNLVSFISVDDGHVLILYNHHLHYISCGPFNHAVQTVNFPNGLEFDEMTFREADQILVFHDDEHIVYEIPLKVLVTNEKLTAPPQIEATWSMTRSDYSMVVVLCSHHETRDICLVCETVNGNECTVTVRSPHSKRMIHQWRIKIGQYQVKIIKTADRNSFLIVIGNEIAKFTEAGISINSGWPYQSEESIQDIMFDDDMSIIYCLTDTGLLLLDPLGKYVGNVTLPTDEKGFSGIAKTPDNKLVLSSARGGCMYKQDGHEWRKFGETYLTRPSKMVVDDNGFIVVIDGRELKIISSKLDLAQTISGPDDNHDIVSVVVPPLAVSAGHRCYVFDKQASPISD